MPTIYKPKKKSNNHPKREKAKAIYDTVYNTALWRRLRGAYLQSHPLCEMCEKNGILTPAVEVHHVTPISTADTIVEMQGLGFDADNLMALCACCHDAVHKKKKK